VIAFVMPYLSPDLPHDLATYSARWGLPAPRLTMIDWGHAPPASPRDPGQALPVTEGTADAEMAHAMAPGAALVYVQTPGPPVGGAGLAASGAWAGPELTAALTWTADRVRPDVVSFSGGWPEAVPAALAARYLPGKDRWAPLMAARSGLEAAARAGVTVVTAAGDDGGGQPSGPGGQPAPGVGWPASDPLVTAVGGTWLHADPAGNQTGPDTAWTLTCGGQAGGGGQSAAFGRPAWQDGVRAVTGARRGVPDVSMNADPRTPVWVYITGNSLPGARSGWSPAWGTSLATPLFAGVVADAAALAGHPLGPIGPALYRMRGPADGIADVTAGSTATAAVPGWPARPGYDLATGVGTVADVGSFTRALARLSISPRKQA
jgi:subtilase family serine protease